MWAAEGRPPVAGRENIQSWIRDVPVYQGRSAALNIRRWRELGATSGSYSTVHRCLNVSKNQPNTGFSSTTANSLMVAPCLSMFVQLQVHFDRKTCTSVGTGFDKNNIDISTIKNR